MISLTWGLRLLLATAWLHLTIRSSFISESYFSQDFGISNEIKTISVTLEQIRPSFLKVSGKGKVSFAINGEFGQVISEATCEVNGNPRLCPLWPSSLKSPTAISIFLAVDSSLSPIRISLVGEPLLEIAHSKPSLESHLMIFETKREIGAPSYLTDVDVKKKVGFGGSAEVMYGFDYRIGKDVAIKIVMKDHLTKKPGKWKQALDEVAIMKSLPDHPTICRIWNSYITRSKIFIELEYFKGKSLASLFVYSKKPKEMKEEILKPIIRRALEGLAEIHRANIYHLDFRANNILLDKKTGNIKIIDFGTAVKGDQLMTGHFEFDQRHVETPEVALGLPYRPSLVDSFQAAETIYFLLFKRKPFPRYNTIGLDSIEENWSPQIELPMRAINECQSGIFENNRGLQQACISCRLITANIRYDVPSEASQELRDLLSKVFTYEDRRLTVFGMLDHPWFSSI